MFNRYFQQELSYLRELGAEFSRAHPALAPMLSGPTADPDVERLLEGVAFLTGLLRQKLDDDFPEIVHDLMDLICPHYLRPVPSSTALAFIPKPILKGPMIIPAGVYVSSVPVDGTGCLFKTCYDVEIHPLSIVDAAFAHPSGKRPFIKLVLELKGIDVSAWEPKALRFFLSGDYGAATDLYLLLCRYLKSIRISSVENESTCVLSPDHLKPAGFSNEEGLIPYPSHAFPGFRVLQEYFILAEKFLFLDLFGWERWRARGEGSRFEISFELEDLPIPPPSIKKDSFTLFVTPAINIFPHEADPIQLDHQRTHYSVRPYGANREHYQISSVDEVVGYVQGTAEEKGYVPYEVFNPDAKRNPAYHITRRESPLEPGFDVYLSVAYSPDAGSPQGSETLSLRLTCTNGSLPEALKLGDVSQPTTSSPEFAECRNILPPTKNILPPLGRNLIWRLLSHLSLNYLTLSKTDHFRALLDFYMYPESRDYPTTVAHRKRIAGIERVKATPSNRLVSGVMMRGQEVELKLNRDHFASEGDLFLFGCVLDTFLGGYASINSFTRVTVTEVMKGKVYRWPARLGNRHLV